MATAQQVRATEKRAKGLIGAFEGAVKTERDKKAVDDKRRAGTLQPAPASNTPSRAPSSTDLSLNTPPSNSSHRMKPSPSSESQDDQRTTQLKSQNLSQPHSQAEQSSDKPSLKRKQEAVSSSSSATDSSLAATSAVKKPRTGMCVFYLCSCESLIGCIADKRFFKIRQ